MITLLKPKCKYTIRRKCRILIIRISLEICNGAKQLSLLADAPTSRYEYAYQMPTDPAVITIMTVTNNDHPIPYSRYGDKIYLNGYGSESKIYMDYVFRQDESLFPTYFRLALAYRLASVFGAAIGRDADILQSYEVKD